MSATEASPGGTSGRCRRMALAAAAALAAQAGASAALGGCLEVARPAGPKAAAVRDVETSTGVDLEEGCVPTGAERCFDALDDNCNGVIDEGCGLRTGVLQFAIAWSEPDVDVDLQVTGPDGELAQLDEPSPAGLVKDRDCPSGDEPCRGQNIENVYLAEGAPRRGRYRVAVRLEDAAGSTGPVRVRLSARIGQRHFTTELELTTRREQREFSFTL